MGVAIDTIAGLATMGTTPALAAVTMANGDSNTVRSFQSPASALLEQVIGGSTGAYQVGVSSPYMYDNIRGFRFRADDLPAGRALPRLPLQMLRSQDTLNIQVEGAASAAVLAALSIYYSDIAGIAQDLAMWGDIAGNIANVYGLEVDVTSSGTAGDWEDTVITTTVDQMKGNTRHAILGWTQDAAMDVIAIKGQGTGSLRVGGAGNTDTQFTSQFFVDMSNAFGTPHIPVINSADKNNTFISTAHHAASQSANIVLILAELTN